jgi:ABC-type nitrate/sulfonate/bicarbonate transport system substrate-binding protein
MTTKIKIASSVLVLVLIGIIAFIAWRGERHSGSQVLHVSLVLPSTGAAGKLLNDIAQDKGFYAKEGVSVNSIYYQHGNAGMMLVSGTGDVAFSGVDAYAAYAATGQAKIIADLQSAFPFYAVSRFPASESSKIRTVASVGTGNMRYLISAVAARDAGADMGNVHFVNAQNDAESIVLLDKGTVDFTTIGSLSLLQNSGAQKKYYVSSIDDQIRKDGFLLTIQASASSLQKNETAISAFLKAIDASQGYVLGHRDETVAYMEAKYGESSQDAGQFYNGFVRASTGISFVPNISDLAPAISFTAENLHITTTREISGFINPDLARAALQ